jgi:hypothetical protein
MALASTPWRRLAVAAAVVCCLVTEAWAIPPIILFEFEFDPEDSRLNITGGFAGIDETHGIEGTFGIAIGYDQVYDPPELIQLVPFASFVGVEGTLTRPGLLEGADLDSLLNLTGLEGTFVHGPGRPGLLFEGVDGQGQPMKVKVGIENRKLRMTGANNAGCCDMFNYRLNASAKIPFLGDIDKDGHVGIADLNGVLGSWGQTVTPMQGPDLDWDGYVGIGDLNAVLGDWGTGPGDGGGLSTVPEPTTACLILPGLAWLTRRRR